MGQPREVRERMAARVADFVHFMLVDVFNAAGSAQYALDVIIQAGSHDLGPKAGLMEQPEEWTEEKIRQRAANLDGDKGPQGSFDD
jgi:hypothetical protein